MPFEKRPRQRTTVVSEGRTVPVEYYTTLEKSTKRVKVHFRAGGGRATCTNRMQRDELSDTISEAEVQAVVLAHLGKHPLALPATEEDEDPGACAVDAGEEGRTGARS